MKTIKNGVATELRQAAYTIQIQPGMRTELTNVLRALWTSERINLVADLLLEIGEQMSGENVAEVGDSVSSELLPDFGHASSDPRSGVWQAAIVLARSLNE